METVVHCPADSFSLLVVFVFASLLIMPAGRAAQRADSGKGRLLPAAAAILGRTGWGCQPGTPGAGPYAAI